MKKQELIEKLKLAVTIAENMSIKVSDVITMIEELEDSEPASLLEDAINDIARDIASDLNNQAEDLVESFEIDTDVNGNSIDISLGFVSYDTYTIESTVENIIKSYVNKEEE